MTVTKAMADFYEGTDHQLALNDLCAALIPFVAESRPNQALHIAQHYMRLFPTSPRAAARQMLTEIVLKDQLIQIDLGYVGRFWVSRAMMENRALHTMRIRYDLVVEFDNDRRCACVRRLDADLTLQTAVRWSYVEESATKMVRQVLDDIFQEAE